MTEPARIPKAVRALLSALGVVSVLGAAETTPQADLARAFLTGSIDLTQSDLQRIDSGQVFSRTLEVRDRREVATLGVVRIKMTPEFTSSASLISSTSNGMRPYSRLASSEIHRISETSRISRSTNPTSAASVDVAWAIATSSCLPKRSNASAATLTGNGRMRPGRRTL